MAKSEWTHVFPINLFREDGRLGGRLSSQSSLNHCGPGNSQQRLPVPGGAKPSLKWEVSVRKAGTGPLLGSVVTTVGPVWTPVEACNTEKSFVLSAFHQSSIFSQRTDILTERVTKSSHYFLSSGRGEKRKGSLCPSIKPEALFTEITSCPKQALSHSRSLF